jgi:hypothetical protein
MLRNLVVLGLAVVSLVGCKALGKPETSAVHRVLLQVRSGAGGGNPNRIDMNGTTSIYVRRFSKAPLDLDKPVSMQEESVAHCNDGRIPEGLAFVVTEVVYRGTSVGDSNGHGEFKLVVGGKVLAQSIDSHLPTSGTWRGRLEITRDRMHDVFLEVANSSTGSAEIIGYLVACPSDAQQADAAGEPQAARG